MPQHTKKERAKAKKAKQGKEAIPRPNPKLLGAGMARDAAEKAKKRREELERIYKLVE